MRVGVLALQGDVPEHRTAVAAVVGPASVGLVRTVEDLRAVDALVLPGGESTTIAELLAETGLWSELTSRLAAGFPVLGTCAGLILLARELEPSPGGRDPPTLGALDVKVRRNEYGTQRESFEGPVEVEGLDGPSFPGVFVRAPRIVAVGPGARVIARRGTEPVGVRAGRVIGLAFHPELSGDPRLIAMFVAEAQAPGRTKNARATARAKRTAAPTATQK